MKDGLFSVRDSEQIMLPSKSSKFNFLSGVTWPDQIKMDQTHQFLRLLAYLEIICHHILLQLCLAIEYFYIGHWQERVIEMCIP